MSPKVLNWADLRRIRDLQLRTRGLELGLGLEPPPDRPSRPILSIESFPAGAVAFIGEKLISWSDQAAAFSTLREWLIYLKGPPDHVNICSDSTFLPLARILVADVLPMVDYGLLEGSKSFRRLGSDDYKALLHWFRMKVIPATEGTPSYEFLDPGDWASFNKALTLETEGRVLFRTLTGDSDLAREACFLMTR